MIYIGIFFIVFGVYDFISGRYDLVSSLKLNKIVKRRNECEGVYNIFRFTLSLFLIFIGIFAFLNYFIY